MAIQAFGADIGEHVFGRDKARETSRFGMSGNRTEEWTAASMFLLRFG